MLLLPILYLDEYYSPVHSEGKGKEAIKSKISQQEVGCYCKQSLYFPILCDSTSASIVFDKRNRGTHKNF